MLTHRTRHTPEATGRFRAQRRPPAHWGSRTGARSVTASWRQTIQVPGHSLPAEFRAAFPRGTPPPTPALRSVAAGATISCWLAGARICGQHAQPPRASWCRKLPGVQDNWRLLKLGRIKFAARGARSFPFKQMLWRIHTSLSCLFRNAIY